MIWKKRHDGSVSFLSALRDSIVSLLPIKNLSPRWSRLLYGNNISFVFLTHPRSEQDIFKVFPLSRILKKILPPKIFFKFLLLCPAYVVAHVKSLQGHNGVFVSTPLLPEELFANRNKTLSNAEKILTFIKKITHERVYVGLAAWWPIVTNGGMALQRFSESNDRIVITNGHCATLASLVLSVEKICSLAKHPLKRLKILIIGAGKMGGAAAVYFRNKVEEICLVDQSQSRLERLERELADLRSQAKVKKVVVTPQDFAGKVIPALTDAHLALCTTSNVGYVINDSTLLNNCIVLDDARPEAFPRVFDRAANVAVLEGGLIKVPGIECDMDFGFGKSENIFGCLAEAFLLRLNELQSLRPTLGDIDSDNFEKLLLFCKQNGISEGDFKCGQQTVDESAIREIFNIKSKKTDVRN